MDDKQLLLTELLNLKLILVKKLNAGTFRVETQDLLDKVDEILSSVEKL